MKKFLKKRGQKIVKASIQASESGKEHIKENFIERLPHIKNIRLLIFEWILLITALIMLAVTQAFWSVESYSGKAFIEGGTYTEATLGKVSSLNPLFATTSSEKVLSKLLFATIATNDYSGNPGIGLAKSITSSENGKVWTIKLRDNLKWSDNEPITNKDVIFTVKLIQNNAVNSIYDSNLANVVVSETETGEIIFKLSAAYSDFISALNIPVLPEHILKDVAPETLVENSFSISPVTSGPFGLNAIQTLSTEGEKIFYLTANQHYYKGKPLLNSFAIHTFNTKSAILNAINSDTVTATAELSAADAENISLGGIQEKISNINSGVFLFFNTANAPLKDSSVRAAIRQGINISKIREIAKNTTPLDYPILSSQIKLTNYPIVPAYNQESSKQQLAYVINTTSPTLNIVTVNNGYLPQIADEVAWELRQLGYNTSISSYEENQDFITNIISNRAYDILIYEIELGADPDPLPYYHSTQVSTSGLNLSNYKSTFVDNQLLSARETLDDSLRIAKYESFLNYWVSDVPAIGLYQSNLAYYYNKNVKPFDNDVRLITPLDRFTTITSWASISTTKNRTP